MPRTITEALPSLITQDAPDGDAGKFLIQLISPGWGSSGYYSAEVLQKAAKDKVFPAGTQMMINHQTYREANERPEGSLHDLAAVQLEDAYWNGSALVAEAKPFVNYREVLSDMKDAIGVSIRATADIDEGEAEGRRGVIVLELIEAITVDFVTKAGRGGKILEVMESARVLREATNSDRADQLQLALPERCWLRDFDETARIAYYGTYDRQTDRAVTWQQAFTVADDDQSVALTGDRTEVRPVTTYVPVSSAGPSTTTESSKEIHMPQIEESRLRELEEKANQVAALEAERDREKVAREAAEKQLRDRDLHSAAVAHAKAAFAESALQPAAIDRIVAEATRTVPATDAGVLDTVALDAAIETARKAEEAYLANFVPAGVTGFGPSAPAAESALPKVTTNLWGRKITKEA